MGYSSFHCFTCNKYPNILPQESRRKSSWSSCRPPGRGLYAGIILNLQEVSKALKRCRGLFKQSQCGTKTWCRSGNSLSPAAKHEASEWWICSTTKGHRSFNALTIVLWWREQTWTRIAEKRGRKAPGLWIVPVSWPDACSAAISSSHAPK